MGLVSVDRWDEAVDGAFTEPGLRRKLEDRGYRVHRNVYPPETRFAQHSHGEDHVAGIVAGTFRVVIEGEAVVLSAGDWVAIPSRAPHSAEVIGEEAVVSLDGVRT